MATGPCRSAGKPRESSSQRILKRDRCCGSRLNPGVPPELERIIRRALEKDRELRYQQCRRHAGRIAALEPRHGYRPYGGGQFFWDDASGAGKQRLSGGGNPTRPKFQCFSCGGRGALSEQGDGGRSSCNWWKEATEDSGSRRCGHRRGPDCRRSYFRSHSATPLTGKDTVVLADFANTTGDPVFDGTLKQALGVDLEQSPYLQVIPQSRVQQTLGFMGRQPNERLTYDVARELCQRVGSKAMLSGSIASLGSQYVLTLNAISCQTGDSLAQEQAQAASKEQVLAALGGAVSRGIAREAGRVAGVDPEV